MFKVQRSLMPLDARRTCTTMYMGGGGVGTGKEDVWVAYG